MSGEANSVRMDCLSRQAEQELEACPGPLRARLVEVLDRPISGLCCEPLLQLARYKVGRFRVGSIRGLYRIVPEFGMCVLRIVDRSEFQHVTDHYNGNLPNQVVPIKESTVMAKYRNNSGVPKEGSSAVSSAEPQAAPAEPPLSTDWMLLLPQAIRGIADQQVQGIVDQAVKGEQEVRPANSTPWRHWWARR